MKLQAAHGAIDAVVAQARGKARQTGGRGVGATHTGNDGDARAMTDDAGIR